MSCWHIADLVGTEVDYEPSTGTVLHGTITSATYSTAGEARADHRPGVPSV